MSQQPPAHPGGEPGRQQRGTPPGGWAAPPPPAPGLASQPGPAHPPNPFQHPAPLAPGRFGPSTPYRPGTPGGPGFAARGSGAGGSQQTRVIVLVTSMALVLALVGGGLWWWSTQSSQVLEADEPANKPSLATTPSPPATQAPPESPADAATPSDSGSGAPSDEATASESDEPDTYENSERLTVRQYGRDWKFRLGNVRHSASYVQGWDYDDCSEFEASPGALARQGCINGIQMIFNAHQGNVKLDVIVLEVKNQASATRIANKASRESVRPADAGLLSDFRVGYIHARAKDNYVVVTYATGNDSVTDPQVKAIGDWKMRDLSAALTWRRFG